MWPADVRWTVASQYDLENLTMKISELIIELTRLLAHGDRPVIVCDDTHGTYVGNAKDVIGGLFEEGEGRCPVAMIRFISNDD